MKKNWKKLTGLCLAGGLILTQAVGCGQKADTKDAQETTEAQKSAAPEDTSEITDITINADLGEGGKKSITYLAEDLNSQWEEEDAVLITLNGSEVTAEGEGVRIDGTTAVIEKAGTYVVSGALEDGQIRIEAGKDEVVRLVLNGAEISNKTTSAIYAPEKAKVILTLADGSVNKVSDASEYQFESEEEEGPDAAIFTKGDLSINGTGALEVQGNYGCGIRSKEDLIAASGNVTITSVDDGLKGKDSVVIREGNYQITSGKDGIKSNNDEEEDKGYIWIDGGSITIAADDDGIQAETALIVYGGEIDITKCQEGLAGKSVDILDGRINAVAEDDAINSAGPAETEQEKMQDQDGVYTRIAGGEIHLNASADGIDSNGDLYFEGGTLYLSGPTNAGNGIIDYNGSSSISGGTLFAADTSGMMQTFGEESTQNYMVICYEETQEAGTEVTITDADGTVLASYAPEKEFAAVIFSSPELTAGDTCQVTTGENTIDLTIEEGMTSHGNVPMGHGGMPGQGGPGRRGGFGGPQGEMPEGMTPPEGGFPEGMEPPEGMEHPDGMTPPDGESPQGEMPEGMERPERGQGRGKGVRSEKGTEQSAHISSGK